MGERREERGCPRLWMRPKLRELRPRPGARRVPNPALLRRQPSTPSARSSQATTRSQQTTGWDAQTCWTSSESPQFWNRCQILDRHAPQGRQAGFGRARETRTATSVPPRAHPPPPRPPPAGLRVLSPARAGARPARPIPAPQAGPSGPSQVGTELESHYKQIPQKGSHYE